MRSSSESLAEVVLPGEGLAYGPERSSRGQHATAGSPRGVGELVIREWLRLGRSVPDPGPRGVEAARIAWVVASSAVVRFGAEASGPFRSETLRLQVECGQRYLTLHLLEGRAGLSDLAEQVLDLACRARAEGAAEESWVQFGHLLLSAHRTAGR